MSSETEKIQDSIFSRIILSQRNKYIENNYLLSIELKKKEFKENQIALTYLYKEETKINIEIKGNSFAYEIPEKNVPSENSMDKILFKLVHFSDENRTEDLFFKVNPTYVGNSWLLSLEETDENTWNERLIENKNKLSELKIIEITIEQNIFKPQAFDLKIIFNKFIDDDNYIIMLSLEPKEEYLDFGKNEYTIKDIPFDLLHKERRIKLFLYKGFTEIKEYYLRCDFFDESGKPETGVRVKFSEGQYGFDEIDSHTEKAKELRSIESINQADTIVSSAEQDEKQVKKKIDYTEYEELKKANEELKQKIDGYESKIREPEQNLIEINYRYNELNITETKIEGRDKSNSDLITRQQKVIENLKSIIFSLSGIKRQQNAIAESNTDEKNKSGLIESIKLSLLKTNFYQFKYNSAKSLPSKSVLKTDLIYSGKEINLNLVYNEFPKSRTLFIKKIPFGTFPVEHLNKIQIRISLFANNQSNITKYYSVDPEKKSKTSFNLLLSELTDVEISKATVSVYSKTFRLGIHFSKPFNVDDKYSINYDQKEYFPSDGSSFISTDDIPLEKFPSPDNRHSLFLNDISGNIRKYLIYADPDSPISPRDADIISLNDYLDQEVFPLFQFKDENELTSGKNKTIN